MTALLYWLGLALQKNFWIRDMKSRRFELRPLTDSNLGHQWALSCGRRCRCGRWRNVKGSWLFAIVDCVVGLFGVGGSVDFGPKGCRRFRNRRVSGNEWRFKESRPRPRASDVHLSEVSRQFFTNLSSSSIPYGFTCLPGAYDTGD